MKGCYFIHEKRPVNGGGNMLSARALVIRRSLAIGDALCATVVADKLIQLGFEVTFQTHPAVHCVIRRHPLISTVTEPGGWCDIDLDGAYEKDPARRLKHFHQMFIEKAQAQVGQFGITLGEALNCKPRLTMPDNEKTAIRNSLSNYPRPWVFICPRSESYNVRQVPDGVWAEAAARIIGTKFWIGRHPAPPGIVDLKAQHFDHVVNWLSVADLMISVDTGPLHVAAAFGVPCVAINQSSSPELHLSDQCDYVMVSPALNCLNCQQNVCPLNNHLPPCQNVSAELIAAWSNAKLRPMTNPQGVSAVVAIYRPDASTLNRCLSALIPQVDEIIIASDTMGVVPAGALQHEKIKYVRKGLSNIGYGRKANFAARHSTNRFLLLVNDDCFLDPEAVARMRDVMRPDVGIVSNLLRYPDGTIYHSGKVRSPGVRGWGHANHRQTTPYFSEPTEQENTCGCCMLVRREMFYQINGFDEDFFLFAEDDAFCLAARQAGWKIMFTPHSTGIHMEHQSVNKTGDLSSLLQKSNAVFTRKWGPYLEHNLNRIPGTFDY